MAGFRFAYRESGGYPTIQKFAIADATLTRGDLVNLEASQLDLSVTADIALVGAVQETIKGGTVGTDEVEAITDDDAVYSVVDNNARKAGATLDISGATGAQGVAASVNADVVVAADSTASQETLVRIVPSQHYVAGK